MIKKIITLFIIFFLCINSITLAKNSEKELLALTKNAGYKVDVKNMPKAAILINAENGQVLWSLNPDVKRDPASVSKMATLYLVYEEIRNGNLSLDTKITATENDENIAKIRALSNSKIKAGVDYSVEELIKMTLVPSSNVATLMLARQIKKEVDSKNDNLVLDILNNKFKDLEMNNTHFYTATGAVASAFEGYYNPSNYNNDKYNESTARDLAILAYHFLKNFPEVLKYTKDNKITTMAGTPYEETFKSYNQSLKGSYYEFEGVDGLKTGSSPSAGFNIMATAKRGDTRLIVIILGVGDWSDQQGEYYRHPFVNALFKYGFDNFQKYTLEKKGSHKYDGYDIQLDSDIVVYAEKGKKPTLSFEEYNKNIKFSAEFLVPRSANNKYFAINPSVEYINSDIAMRQINYKKETTINNIFKDIYNQFKNPSYSTIMLIPSLIPFLAFISIITFFLFRRKKNKNNNKKEL